MPNVKVINATISKTVIHSGKMPNVLMVTLVTMLLAGCATTPHDEQLFSRNSPVALKLTETQSQSALSCKETKGAILSQQIIQERQFHEVTVFQIKVKGCGKEALYVTRCDDEKNALCDAKLQSNHGK